MPDTWKPKRFAELSPEQQGEKLKRDKDYETAVQELYQTLPREQAALQKEILWQAYIDWAKTAGIYEKITPEAQLAEVEASLNSVLNQVNRLRAETGKPLKLIKEA